MKLPVISPSRNPPFISSMMILLGVVKAKHVIAAKLTTTNNNTYNKKTLMIPHKIAVTTNFCIATPSFSAF